jgi:hypothetical protein
MTWRRVVFPLGHVGPSRRSVDMGTAPIHPTSAQTSERDILLRAQQDNHIGQVVTG